ncbi:hypothetical protein GGI15_000456 [Coemansia interrupta]|uniref:RRM domain-containing protein n=1 Tax=Coemansia interrupta TaxID=1126814 RepID=A0A9W8HL84_9FUNG|nr:hypothetical protein GGI15_000456 [Coemansia interrupta]
MFRNTLARATAFKRLAQTQQARNLASCTMYVRNLPIDFDEAKLKPYVEEFGPIYQVNFTQRRPGDRYSIAFVRFYGGELPATLEELAACPDPTPEEVSEVTKRCTDAISALDGQVINGHNVNAAFGMKNSPDSIQFNARINLRKANDPEFAKSLEQKRQTMRDGRPMSNDSYQTGYKNGFKDGFEAAKNEIKV